jgi:hypothetical protein
MTFNGCQTAAQTDERAKPARPENGIASDA